MSASNPLSPVITHFAARAGDHNDRAMQASGMIAAELAARLGSAPVVIGSPEPALCTNWEEELAAAQPALRGKQPKLAESAQRSIRARYAEGGLSIADLAEEYRVGRSTIHHVSHGDPATDG